MPTITKDNQIIDLLTRIDQRTHRIESALFDESDEDLYRPEVIKLIKARARQARKEFRAGKTITLEELERELGL